MPPFRGLIFKMPSRHNVPGSYSMLPRDAARIHRKDSHAFCRGECH